VVENGKQAVEAVIAAASENAPFSLVLMDMQMPIMTGHEAVRELRRLGFELPIIALTADAMDGEREACIKMGCNEYFPKPIDGPRLMNSIASLIQQP
jgi:CheY-like chemotaxis protein